MTGKKILICDDQSILHETIGAYLNHEGFQYISAFNGEEALTMFFAEKPDLVILDIMMPKINGIEVCTQIRRASKVPVIMLTAKGEEIDRVLGLELGADDYIVKPFSVREVISRIKAVLRRFDRGDEIQSGVITFDDLIINIGNYEVIIKGAKVPFTPKEVEILNLLASNPGHVFEREQILAKVWGYNDYFGDLRAVDTQIKRIRQKLPNDVSWGIKTVYGIGYKFEAEA